MSQEIGAEGEKGQSNKGSRMAVQCLCPDEEEDRKSKGQDEDHGPALIEEGLIPGKVFHKKQPPALPWVLGAFLRRTLKFRAADEERQRHPKFYQGRVLTVE